MCSLDTAFFWASYRVAQHFFHWIFVAVLHSWHRGAFSLSDRASETPVLMSPGSWPRTALSVLDALGEEEEGPRGPSHEASGASHVSVTTAWLRGCSWLCRVWAGAVFGRRIYYLAIFLPQLHGKALQRLLCIVLKAPIARSPVSVSASALRPQIWRLEVPVVELFFAPAVCN